MILGKKGSIHLSLLIGVFALLLMISSFHRQSLGFVKRKEELQAMLTFDYQLEAYYLLLHSKELILEGEIAYGQLDCYKISNTKPEGDFSIVFYKTEMGIIVEGTYQDKIRESYIIEQ